VVARTQSFEKLGKGFLNFSFIDAITYYD